MSASQKSELVRLAEKGKYAKAKKIGLKLCKQTPEDPEAWFLLGSVNGAINDYPAAEHCCRKALKFASENPMLFLNLGIALLNQGKTDVAIEQFKNAIKFQPHYADAYLEMANAFKFKRDYLEAISNYKKSIQLNPAAYTAHYYLAETYRDSGYLAESVINYEQALSLNNSHVDSFCGLASALIELYKFDKVVELLETNIQKLPITSCLYYCLAIAYQEQGETKKSELNYKKVLDIDNEHIEAHTGLAGIHALQGQYDKAKKQLKFILNKQPKNISAIITYITFASQMDCIDEAIKLAITCLDNGELNDSTASKLIFSLANLYEKLGKLDNAFEYYMKANKLKGLSFDETYYLKMFDSLIKTYSVDIFEKNRYEHTTAVQPIFIIGMPRSGTSLAEQILASHPEVYGAGELPNINRMIEQLPEMIHSSRPYPNCLSKIDSVNLKKMAHDYLSDLQYRSTGEKYVTDKMPLNAIHLGFISLLFPNALIIHCTRDPRDTCLSCFFQNFSGEHPYAYSLDSLGKFHRMYETLMTHWSQVIPNTIFELSYEDIVKNPEPVIRNLVDYCGLEWDYACLNFHKTKRTVATASHNQVRQKMYTSSVGKWQNYEQYLGELFAALI